MFKNIIICGVAGSGKTTLAQKIANEKQLTYLFIKDLKELKFDDKLPCVIDYHGYILPEDFNIYENKDKFTIIYLGFASLSEDILFNAFRQNEKNANKTDDELRLEITSYCKMGKLMKHKCECFKYKFIDILDRKKSLQEAWDYLFADSIEI